MKGFIGVLFVAVLVGLTESKPRDSKGSIVSVEKPLPVKKSFTTASNTTSPPPTTRAPSTPTYRVLRGKGFKPDERRCCKLGYRAGRKGFFCHLNVYFAIRYQNMEHRKKMKFFGRKPSKRTHRFVRNIERHCIKRGLKGTFLKCCNLYIGDTGR